MKKRRYERPGYVMVIGVLLLVSAGTELLQLVADARIGRDVIADFLAAGDEMNAFATSLEGGNYMLRSPDAGAWIAFGLMVVCGAFIIRGANWARLLFYSGFTGLCIWSYIQWMMDYPTMIPYVVVRLVILGVFCIALSMERANRFFTGRDALFKRRKDDDEGNLREPVNNRFDY